MSPQDFKATASLLLRQAGWWQVPSGAWVPLVSTSEKLVIYTLEQAWARYESEGQEGFLGWRP